MAVLSVATRTRLWKGFMRWWSVHEHAVEQPFSAIAKYDVYNPNTNTGLVADADNWADTHSGNTCTTVGFNGALAEPCKSGLTVATKGFVLSMIVLARYNPELCKNVLGDID
jgi:hypothetical protein